MDKLNSFADYELLLTSQLAANLLTSVVFILILVLIRWIILRIVRRQSHESRIIYNWRKYTTYIFVAVGIVIVAGIWSEEARSVGTFVGLLSAGIAIALKDPLVNLAGWLFIIWRKPFAVGDRVQIGDVSGDIIDQRIFQFTVMEIGNWVDADQHTGRMIMIPNGKVFLEMQYNYNKGFSFVWNEIGVLVTFESNWKKAKEIIEAVVNRHAMDLSLEAAGELEKLSGEYLLLDQNIMPVVYTSVKDSGVMLTARYPCNIKARRDSHQIVWEDLLDGFAKHDDIDFAYPTTRYYYNKKEGKPGAGGE